MKVDAFSFAVTALLLALSSTPASATIPPISSYYVGQPTYWGNLTQDFYNCAVLPECRYAASIFEYCNECIFGAAAANQPTFHPNGTLLAYANGTITYNCLCGTYFNAWNSSLNTCTTCLVKALSQFPPGYAGGMSPDTLPDKIHQDITNYCLHVPNTDFAGEYNSFADLYSPGVQTTNDYGSQILLYNMTVWLVNSTVGGFPPGFVGGGE